MEKKIIKIKKWKLLNRKKENLKSILLETTPLSFEIE